MVAPRYARLAITSAWVIAVLLAAVSLGGLLSPSAYAREAPAWTAQAIGQDWFDALIAAPWIAICAIGARNGSYRWGVLLAGAYAYAVYEMFIYAFAVHFNALFLLYCATLGVAGFALVALSIWLHQQIEPIEPRGGRVAGAYLGVLGLVFGLLWLVEDVPATLHNAASPSLAETGLFTNPVHVIDYAFVLPAHVLAGIWLWRGRKNGRLLGPILLAFGVLMSASIGGMMLVIHLSGGAAPLAVAVVMFVIAAATAAVLARAFHGPMTPLAAAPQR